MAAGAARSQIAVLAGPTWAQGRLELGWAVLEAFRGRGLAAGDTYYTEHSHFRESTARDENPITRGIQVGWRDLQAIIEQGQQVVGDDTLKGVVVREAQAHPKAVKLWAAEESFSFGLEVV